MPVGNIRQKDLALDIVKRFAAGYTNVLVRRLRDGDEILTVKLEEQLTQPPSSSGLRVLFC